MKAVVTGASGFIGARLARELVSGGHSVTCLVRRLPSGPPADAPGGQWVLGDVTDPASLPPAVRGADVVFHLAGLVKAFRFSELLAVNEAGTANVAAACAATGDTPPVLVVVSSLAAAGPSIHGRPRVEEDAAVPVSKYGRSKLAGERAAARFANRVPISIVRPPIVFGERDVAMLPMFRSVARSGIHPVPGFRTRRFSLVHVADLVAGLEACGRRGSRLAADAANGESSGGWSASGQGLGTGDQCAVARDGPNVGCYYVAADEQPTYSDLGRLIGEALDKRARVVHTPEWAAWCIAAGSELLARYRGRPSIINLDKMREATAGSWICSAERARRELAFRPAAPLAARLRETAAWYREQGLLE